MKKFGLIGERLGHSFSERFFNDKFRNEGISASYTNYEISDLKRLKDIIENTPELVGLNVTIPYKEEILSVLNHISPEVKIIGAVNVIKIIRYEDRYMLYGYNTDTTAFEATIKKHLKKNHQKALILGTGGSSKAIDFALNKIGVKTTKVSRNYLSGTINYQNLNESIISEHQIIINCTPCGMYPKTEACPQIPYEYITTGHILYDLIYNPDETLFLKKGKECGALTINGLEMLLLQAQQSWQIWNE